MSQFIRNPALMTSDVGPDIVALHVDRGECFGLSDVSADIWRLLEKRQSIDALCGALLSQYDVDPATCRSQVSELIDQMLLKGLITAA